MAAGVEVAKRAHALGAQVVGVKRTAQRPADLPAEVEVCVGLTRVAAVLASCDALVAEDDGNDFGESCPAARSMAASHKTISHSSFAHAVVVGSREGRGWSERRYVYSTRVPSRSDPESLDNCGQ